MDSDGHANQNSIVFKRRESMSKYTKRGRNYKVGSFLLAKPMNVEASSNQGNAGREFFGKGHTGIDSGCTQHSERDLSACALALSTSTRKSGEPSIARAGMHDRYSVENLSHHPENMVDFKRLRDDDFHSLLSLCR